MHRFLSMTKDIGIFLNHPIPLTDFRHLVSVGFGTGLIARAPGTWGALLAIPVFLTLGSCGPITYTLVVSSLFLAGIHVAGRTARALGVHDHNAIVIDEVVGMLVAWVAVDPGWLAVVAGFALFRLIDILKPWPVYWLDRRVTGGLGIMLDDLVAGLMAAAVLALIAD